MKHQKLIFVMSVFILHPFCIRAMKSEEKDSSQLITARSRSVPSAITPQPLYKNDEIKRRERSYSHSSYDYNAENSSHTAQLAYDDIARILVKRNQEIEQLKKDVEGLRDDNRKATRNLRLSLDTNVNFKELKVVQGKLKLLTRDYGELEECVQVQYAKIDSLINRLKEAQEELTQERFKHFQESYRLKRELHQYEKKYEGVQLSNDALVSCNKKLEEQNEQLARSNERLSRELKMYHSHTLG